MSNQLHHFVFTAEYTVFAVATQTDVDGDDADFFTFIVSPHEATTALKTRPPQLIVSELAGKVPKFVVESSK